MDFVYQPALRVPAAHRLMTVLLPDIERWKPTGRAPEAEPVPAAIRAV